MAGASGAKERGDGPGAGGQEGVFHRLLCSEKASKVPITSQLSGQGGGILGKVYLFFFFKQKNTYSSPYYKTIPVKYFLKKEKESAIFPS